MDLSKFLAMLQTKSLWFSRADCLGDPLEGSVPRARFDSESLARQPDDDQLSDWRRTMLTKTHISCWHANDGESAAMWSLYAKSDEAICVRTVFGKLSQAFPECIFGGLVKYIDYDVDDLPSLNLLEPLIHKRRSFAHENEFRLFAWELSADARSDEIRQLAGAAGLSWPLDPNQYVEEVYVSPTSPDWFRSTVERAVRDYGLNCPVHRSTLLTSPLY